MKIMKKVLAADNPAEEIELAIEELKLKGKITDDDSARVRETLELMVEYYEYS